MILINSELGNEGIYTIYKIIIMKANALARREIELASYDAEAQHIR